MKKWLIILLGIFLMSISLTQFLEPYAIVIGGATGIGIIFKQLFNIPLSLTFNKFLHKILLERSTFYVLYLH